MKRRWWTRPFAARRLRHLREAREGRALLLGMISAAQLEALAEWGQIVRRAGISLADAFEGLGAAFRSVPRELFAPLYCRWLDEQHEAYALALRERFGDRA